MALDLRSTSAGGRRGVEEAEAAAAAARLGRRGTVWNDRRTRPEEEATEERR